MLAELFSLCCNLLETLHGHIVSNKGKSFSSISVSRMNGQQLISMASSTVSKLMEVDSSSSLKLAMSICVKFGFEEWRKEIKMRTTEMKMRHFVTKGKSLLAIQVARTGEEQLCLYNCLIEEKLFIEAQEVLRSFRWLAGKVAPISQADLALQHQSDRTKYLQFPAHTVSIHMVDSMESLSFAASVIGVSLEADHYLDESQCIDSGDGDVIDASKKTAANESRNLRHFLERGVKGEATLKGFKQVVGLDSEWRMIMYAKEIKGASILQISTSQHVFIVDFLTLFRPSNSTTSSKSFTPSTHGRRRNGGNSHRPGSAVKRDYQHIDESSSLSSESLADVAARFLERLFADSTILKLGWSFGEDMKMVKKAMGGNRPDTLLVTRSLLELSDLPNIFPQEQVGSTELECDEELDDPLSDKAAANTSTPTKNIHSLSTACHIFLGRPLLKREQLSNWDSRPLQLSQLQYAALDAHCLIELLEMAVLRSQAVNLKGTKSTNSLELDNEIKGKDIRRTQRVIGRYSAANGLNSKR
mmetsp:Transcript_19578/g.26824  ORF Transcript_19578/g.26824 Transcript_19578/m.26824 type:complete len:529 (-) Transcript_19578:258-1844(-)